MSFASTLFCRLFLLSSLLMVLWLEYSVHVRMVTAKTPLIEAHSSSWADSEQLRRRIAVKPATGCNAVHCMALAIWSPKQTKKTKNSCSMPWSTRTIAQKVCFFLSSLFYGTHLRFYVCLIYLYIPWNELDLLFFSRFDDFKSVRFTYTTLPSLYRFHKVG